MDVLYYAAIAVVFFILGAAMVGIQFGPALFNAYHRWTVRRWERKQ